MSLYEYVDNNSVVDVDVDHVVKENRGNEPDCVETVEEEFEIAYEDFDDDFYKEMNMEVEKVLSKGSPQKLNKFVDRVHKSREKGLLVSVQLEGDHMDKESDEDYDPNQDSEADDCSDGYRDSDNEVDDEFVGNIDNEDEFVGIQHVEKSDSYVRD
ncbi:hypothetical protein Dimus_034114 [Dionaea muscipula]